MPRPFENEYPSFYANYVNLAIGNSIKELIENHSNKILEFIQLLPNEQENFTYAEDKWTIKEVIQHCIDAERVFIYRALRFARKDATPLPGFDENEYAQAAKQNNRSFAKVKDEFELLRKSSDTFLLSLQENDLTFLGTANGNSISLNAICFIVFGHLLHHQKIILERYLTQ